MIRLAPVGSGHNLLTERVYRTLKDAIQSWQLRPGHPLVESKLAIDLEVSKTPIRESLVRLAREGLVEAAPYRSYRVADFTADDAQSIMELRAVLEGLAARRSCERLSTEERGRIVDLTYSASLAADDERWAQASDLVHEVHVIVVAGCADARLKSMIDVLNGQYERARHLLPLNSERLLRSIAEHNDLAAAIATKQAVLAEQVMRMHLTSMVETARHGVEHHAAIANETSEPSPPTVEAPVVTQGATE